MKKYENKNLKLGIAFYTIHLLFSFINDSLTKYLIIKISGWQILFFRLFFGALMLSILMLTKGVKSFKTHRLWLHIIRGCILFLGILIWSYGLKFSTLSQSTLVAFTIPIFVIVLAHFFLKERITKSLCIATIIGFLGILITLKPSNSIFSLHASYLVFSALLFATLDILNKKYVSKEPMLSMLFYSALFSSILTFVPAYKNWVSIDTKQLLMLFTLALSGNLLLFFLLKSFELVNASTLAPFRYLEIIISAVGGWIIFHEHIQLSYIIGACFIIPSSFYIFRKKMES